MPLPDNATHMAEVHTLAGQARSNAEGAQARHASSGERTREETIAALGTIAPIHLGRSHDVIPECYVLHTRQALCLNCGTQSHSSEFYALSYLKSRINGTRVRHLTRCDRPLFDLPVMRIPVGNDKIPFCAECDVISLSHLPPPPSPALLYDLAEPRSKGAKAKTPKSPETKPTTLEDLI